MIGTTAARVKSIISEYPYVEPDALADDMADLGFDSLERVELAMSIEEEFGCADISDEQTAGLKSISDWVDMVVMHVGVKA